MQRKQPKMGKRPAKSNAIRKFETNGKLPDSSQPYSRDSFPDESNDSGLGFDSYSSLLDSNSSSCVEESDLDCSTDSVDSGISSQSGLARCKRPRTSGSVRPPASRAALHVDSTLALSLNRKMHIQHTQSEVGTRTSGSGCFDEPSAKWRRVVPGAELRDGSSGETQEPRDNALASGRNALLQRFPLTPSSGLLNTSVLTEAFHCGNSVVKDSLRNDFENRDLAASKEGNECSARDGYAPKGAPDQNSRNGDRIVALLSSSSNSLARKRPVKKPSLHVCFPSRSKDAKAELCILIQPEEQHRARYMTEGSRGSIKDEKGTGFPTVKLVGYNQPVVLQIFIGSDQGKIQPHLFYQACKVTGKNCTPCSERIIDGTCVIEINMAPDSDMTVSCDCIGILKERNVDVEQRLPYFGLARCKKRSTKCRMVFRVNIPLVNGSYETLQAASSQILCTQSPGLPEICKKSLTESPMAGGSELFIIGKNFQKDAKIVFQQLADDQRDYGSGKETVVWEEIVDPEKEYAHQSHLVCCVPPYRSPDTPHPVKVFLSVLSGGKSSEPHTFTYTPPHAVQKEKFVHSPMHQAGNLSVPLEIGHQFAKPVMESPNLNVSPAVLVTGGDSALRSMMSPPAYMSGGCASPRQLSALSIQLMSPLSSTLLSPLQQTPALANPLDSPGMGNPFGPAESVSMPSLLPNGCGPMMMSGHLSPLERVSGASPGVSTVSPSTLPSSPSHAIAPGLQLAAPEPPKTGRLPCLSLAGEEHHEVDLMSGINQLATEMVRAQEDAASSRVTRMATDVAAQLNPVSDVTSLAAGFVQNCLNMMDVPIEQITIVGGGSCNPSVSTIATTGSPVPSQDVAMVRHLSPPPPQILLAKMEPLPSMEGLEQGIIAAATVSSATAAEVFEPMIGISMPICQASHGLASGEDSHQLTAVGMHQGGDVSMDVKPSLMVIDRLQGEAGAQQRQTSDVPFPSSSVERQTATCSLPDLIETKSAPLEVYAGSIYDPSAGGRSNAVLPGRLLVESRSDVVNFGVRSAAADENKTATVALAAAGDLVLAPSAVKTEKPDRAASLSCFQQTMTLALSKLSEADLLSIINPNAFDTV